MEEIKTLGWKDYFYIAPLYVSSFPDDDLASLSSQDLILRVRSLPCFDDQGRLPSDEIISRLRWLIIDQMNMMSGAA